MIRKVGGKNWEGVLWCDLKTDQDKADFLWAGKGWQTGIIADALTKEIVEVFEFCANNNREGGNR